MKLSRILFATSLLALFATNSFASDLYFNVTADKELIKNGRDHIPIASFVTAVKQENDTFFWGKEVEISTPISVAGPMYVDNMINQAFKDAGLRLKMLAPNTYYVYKDKKPLVLGHAEKDDIKGNSFLAMPGYLMDTLFLISHYNSYRVLWDENLERESNYINNILEFQGTSLERDLRYLSMAAEQVNDNFSIAINDELKVIKVTHKETYIDSVAQRH